MLKTHLAACLLSTALLAGPALAQTNPPAATPPATTAPAVNPPPTTMPSTTGAASGMQGDYMMQMSQDQWRASKLVGLNIYGPDNEKIGDVNEVILDKSGTAQAVVIGVGGFLGIGEKNVAVPFKNVEWTYNSRSEASAANRPAGTAPATTANNATVNTTAPAANSTAANTNAPARTDVTGSTVGTTRAMDYPDHGILRQTKEQLKAAPAFHYASDTRR